MSAEKVTSKAASDGSLVFRPDLGPAGDVLVNIFLRGGMDSVYTLPPFADPALHEQRKGFGCTEPGRDGMVALNDFLGLHPAFAPLEQIYRDKLLAIVRAVGLAEPLLSHFEAAAALERGISGQQTSDGWIGRHLTVQKPSHAASPLRAVALGKSVPAALRGSEARLLDSLSDIRLEVPAAWGPDFRQALGRLYARGTDLASVAGRGTLETLAVLERLTSTAYVPEHRAKYPYDNFGGQMRQLAQLIKAEVGLEAAALNMYGWDSHTSQANSLAAPMASLARGLRGFAQDLGDRMRRVVVVVLSEFGRRIAPNAAGGTDHGRATAMLIIGGGIDGGKMYGRWPGIAPDQLDEQGNLRVITDYRHVLAEIVDKRLRNAAVKKVFPDFEPKYLNFTRDDA